MATWQFVDSVSTSPTVRLDLNAGGLWVGDGFDLSPPPLRRAFASLMLTDGDFQTGWAYRNRTLKIPVQLVMGSVDAAATALQLLGRELARDTNFLRVQFGSVPYFFRTFAAPDYTFSMLKTLVQDGRATLEIPAEPFAYGPREDVAVGTVTNDPAAATRGNFFDVADVKGDVPAPLIIKDTSSGLHPFGILATRSRGVPSDLVWFAQAEDAAVVTTGTDTSNPGGGPDAAMSGTGTNNFVRTTFGGFAAMAARVTWSLNLSVLGNDGRKRAIRGTYRVFVVVRRSGAASTITARISYAAGPVMTTGATVTIPATAERQLVDLGLFSVGPADPWQPGRFGFEAPLQPQPLEIHAARSGGADTLDWDLILLVPADESWLSWFTGASEDAGYDALIDGEIEFAYLYENGADPFAGAADIIYPTKSVQFAGGFPMLKPGATNRIFMLTSTSPTTPGVTTAKADTYTITAHYYPRYLFIRPATT